MNGGVRAVWYSLLLLTAAGVLLGSCRPRADVSVNSIRVRVAQVLSTVPLVDGHNDLLIHFIQGDSLLPLDSYDISRRTRGQTDIPRWRAGRVGASFVTVSGAHRADVERGLRETLGFFDRLAARYPSDLAVVTSAAAVPQAHAAGRIALILHVEGGEQLQGSIPRLRTLHTLGVRSLGLTWSRTNDLADAAGDTARWGGVSPVGEGVVREMNRLGMIIDLSHASDRAALAVLALSKAPVMFSHSSARELAEVSRNVPDHVLRALASNGGVVMVTFVPYFTTKAYADWYARGEAVWDTLRERHGADRNAASVAMKAWEAANPPPSVNVVQVADHVEHIRTVAGIDHVGLGSDFDGMFSFVSGLEDVASFPRLFEELARRGWSNEDLRKLAGDNVLRVMAAVEGVAATIR
jgi:membrane dipeptidase